jgi:HK97 family phage major capsid protein
MGVNFEGMSKDLLIGLSRRDIERYSLSNVIMAQANHRQPAGLEAECHQELTRMGGHGKFEGIGIPYDVLFYKRDLTVTTFGAGGAFVQTDVSEQVIPILRNASVALRMGVKVVSGLSSNLAFPRQISTVTPYSLPETASLTKTNLMIDQIVNSPHRVAAATEISRQLLLQSSPDVEAVVREDLSQTLGVKWDKLILEGSGAGSEPTGILNTQGIGSVHFGATPTFAKMVAFETSLTSANAADVPGARLGYITSPVVKGALKTTPKVANSTFPIYIWEKDRVNDYPAAATNQISNAAVAFGNWADAALLIWGKGVDLLYNPYSRDVDSVVRLTANSFIDISVRHAASFTWSDDRADQ